MRVIVCGGRRYADREDVFSSLDGWHAQFKFSMVIEGGCRNQDGAPSADSLANEWALAREVPCLTVPAKWSVHGRAAGPIRNAEMAKIKHDVCIAFPGAAGTEDMAEKARAAGALVLRGPNLTPSSRQTPSRA